MPSNPRRSALTPKKISTMPPMIIRTAPMARATFWPPYQAGRMMSLRQGNGSVAISDAEFGSEHNCSFWDSLPAG